jgi:hypothetical protein
LEALTPTREQLIERERDICVARLAKINGILNEFRDPMGDMGAEDALMEIGKILKFPAGKLASLSFAVQRS